MNEYFAGPFRDRTHAGQVLSNHLLSYQGDPNLLVLGLTRGGMPVAFEVAAKLSCPLDMFLVRKLLAPGRPDRPIGAVASGGIRILNRDVMREFGVGLGTVEELARKEGMDLARREDQYRSGRPAERACGEALGREADEVICAGYPEPFFAVARWYRDFSPVMDRQIQEMLQHSAQEDLCVSPS